MTGLLLDDSSNESNKERKQRIRGFPLPAIYMYGEVVAIYWSWEIKTDNKLAIDGTCLYRASATTYIRAH